MTQNQLNGSSNTQPIENELVIGEVARPAQDRSAATEATNLSVPDLPPDAADGKSENGQVKAISPQKLLANQANAQRSTGPKTPEGKQNSSQNSRKHGFFARQPFPYGEAGNKMWDVYSELYFGIINHYQPIGYMEQLLAEKVATEFIRFSRLLSFEGSYMGEKGAFHCAGINRILRFQSAINRQLFQTMVELERMQDKRRRKSIWWGSIVMGAAGSRVDLQTEGTALTFCRSHI